MNFLKGSVLICFVAFATSALALTPAERKIVERAKAHLQQAKKDFAEANVEVMLADQRADQAEQHANETDDRLRELEGKIEAAHQNEMKLAAENDKMRPVYEQCRKWWGLGAIAYGFGRLFKNLLITGIVLAVLAGALWGLSFAFPFIGVGLKIAGAFFKSVFNRISALIARLRKKKDPPP